MIVKARNPAAPVSVGSSPVFPTCLCSLSYGQTGYMKAAFVKAAARHSSTDRYCSVGSHCADPSAFSVRNAQKYTLGLNQRFANSHDASYIQPRLLYVRRPDARSIPDGRLERGYSGDFWESIADHCESLPAFSFGSRSGFCTFRAGRKRTA